MRLEDRKTINMEQVRREGIPQWDATGWGREFANEKDRSNYIALAWLRQEVYQSTLDIVTAGKYQLPNGEVITLELERDIAKETKFYSKEIIREYPRQYDTRTGAVNDDCLAYAARLCETEDGVCVLNMANPVIPGGGVMVGAGAQEEYLFRCSDYYRSLYQYARYASQYDVARSSQSYPLDSNYGGVFSPNVTVFRSTEETGYALLEKPWKVNMIAVAGINRPDLEYERGEERIAEHLVPCAKNKLRTILRIAADNSQKTLVLGAIGCGAFRNPPRHIASLFKEILSEEEFKGVFRRVLFVIKEDHNSPKHGNYTPFAKLFGSIDKNARIEPME